MKHASDLELIAFFSFDLYRMVQVICMLKLSFTRSLNSRIHGTKKLKAQNTETKKKKTKKYFTKYFTPAIISLIWKLKC